jgi:hypothetical protein
MQVFSQFNSLLLTESYPGQRAFSCAAGLRRTVPFAVPAGTAFLHGPVSGDPLMEWPLVALQAHDKVPCDLPSL